MSKFNYWPLLVLIPASALYFYFKLTVKDLMGNWSALVRDGIASGSAFVSAGVCFFIYYPQGWLHWLGLVMILWSITYWASAFISYRNLQVQLRGGKVNPPPFSETAKTPVPAQNRQKRRSARKRR